MAWSNSKVHASFILGALDRTILFDLDADTFNVALYDNDITPDNTVTEATARHNTGQWVTSGNEVVDATAWPTGGRPLVTPDVTQASNVVTFDAPDTASNGNGTLSATYGCHVYDNTLANKNGVSYHYFGGAQQVTGGSFTIVWNVSGLFTVTC